MRYFTAAKLGLLMAILTGCPPSRMDLGDDGPAPSDAGADADADADESCPESACFTSPAGWFGPYLLWFGPNGQEPQCPYGGPNGDAYIGYDDLVAPLACEACACGLPTGSCALPSVFTASSSTCATDGPGSLHFPFTAPDAWDGVCDNTTQVSAGEAKSLTIAPLTVTDGTCQVLDPPVPGLTSKPVASSWDTFARACHGQALRCNDPDATCLPTPDPAFRVCVYQEGDNACPKVGNWPEKHVFYNDVEDRRECTECTCGPPQGSMCTALLSVYENSASTCEGPLVFNQLSISSESPGPCHDISPSGKPMGSKSATPPTYIPGTCASIPGLPVEGRIATKIEPSTLCCRPE